MSACTLAELRPLQLQPIADLRNSALEKLSEILRKRVQENDVESKDLLASLTSWQQTIPAVAGIMLC